MKVQVGVGAGAVLALAGLGVAGYLAWRSYQGAARMAQTARELAALGGQKMEAFAVAAQDPYSVQGVLAYGGPLNPIARVAAPAYATFKDIQREGSIGGWLRSVTSDDDQRVRDMLAGTTPQNAIRADVARVEAASSGGATGAW